MPGAPGSGRSAPMLEQAAQAAIAATRPRTGGRMPRPEMAIPPAPWEMPEPLTEADRAEADKASEVCRFCVGYHALPNSPGCPRLASFELDGDGRVKSGTFFEGTKWAKGRVVFYEDTKEDPDAGQ